MSIVAFSHYNLRAPRELLDVLRAFYTEVVGLEAGIRPPFQSFGYWLYTAAKDVLHLTEADDSEDRPVLPSTTFDHAAFNCTDRKTFEARLLHRGIRYEVAHVPLTGQVQLFFRDPAGNGIELNFTCTDA